MHLDRSNSALAAHSIRRGVRDKVRERASKNREKPNEKTKNRSVIPMKFGWNGRDCTTAILMIWTMSEREREWEARTRKKNADDVKLSLSLVVYLIFVSFLSFFCYRIFQFAIPSPFIFEYFFRFLHTPSQTNHICIWSMVPSIYSHLMFCAHFSQNHTRTISAKKDQWKAKREMTKSATQYATLFYEIQIVIYSIVPADRYKSIAGKYLKQKKSFCVGNTHSNKKK